MILFVTLYIAIMVAFIYYDAAVGFGFEWDDNTLPPLWMAAIFWWISIPGTLLFKAIFWCGAVKKRRLAKEAELERIRIATQRDFNSALEEVDEEFPAVKSKRA